MKFSEKILPNQIENKKLYEDSQLFEERMYSKILQSTKLDTKIGRSPIRKNEIISYIDFIKKHSSKVRIELFEETGHYITIEKPETVNKIMLEWIDKL